MRTMTAREQREQREHDADLAALELFETEDFRAGLAKQRAYAQRESRAFAEAAVELAVLAARVPRYPSDHRGGSGWTSFVAEIAVARSCSDTYAHGEIVLATTLVAGLPVTLALLASGQMPVHRARTLVDACYGCDEAVLGVVDAELATKACTLPPARIRRAVKRLLLKIDPNGAARRARERAAARGVSLRDEDDGQASVLIEGPAVDVVPWYLFVDATARALRAAGDERTLDQLRFDVAVAARPPVPGAAAPEGAEAPGTGPAAGATADLSDRRCTRPVQIVVEVPVATLLGHSDEPGHLQGYGPISAPECRELLVGAELRQACVDAATGRLVDLAERVVRPELTDEAVREALVAMATEPMTPTIVTWAEEPAHDPSAALARFVKMRDRYCDFPTGKAPRSASAHLDHEIPYPHGPTSATNLVPRSPRGHNLKHFGWVPLRTATSTIWTSPAGQVVEVPRDDYPPPRLLRDLGD